VLSSNTGSLPCYHKHCLNNMFATEEAFRVFSHMNYAG
jgi:hypothetical protein